MASTITALTSSGGVAFAGDTTGALELKTNNGTTAVTIDTSQNVGIGTSSPSSKLDVNGGDIRLATNATYIRSTSSSGSSVRMLGINVSDTAYVGPIDSGPTSTIFNVSSTSANAYFYTNGTERMRIDSNGNVIITDTTNSSLSAVGCYNETTGSGANMVIASNGFIIRSTSSLKYKQNVKDATHGLADVLKLRPVTYESKKESESGITYGGLIAEEVHDAGLTEFVQYADDGTPDALSYGHMVSLAFKAIQELKAELDTVKAELATLKGTA